MVEYSLDLQIPEYVWDHPVLQEMSVAVIDIMTWPNVRGRGSSASITTHQTSTGSLLVQCEFHSVPRRRKCLAKGLINPKERASRWRFPEPRVLHHGRTRL